MGLSLPVGVSQERVGWGGGVLTFPLPGEQVGMLIISCKPFFTLDFLSVRKIVFFSLFSNLCTIIAVHKAQQFDNSLSRYKNTYYITDQIL